MKPLVYGLYRPFAKTRTEKLMIYDFMYGKDGKKKNICNFVGGNMKFAFTCNENGSYFTYFFFLSFFLFIFSLLCTSTLSFSDFNVYLLLLLYLSSLIKKIFFF